MAQWIKSNLNVDFVGRAKFFGGVSVVAILVSLGALVANWIIRGDALNYGTDFKGGTQIQIEFAKAVQAGEVRHALEAGGFPGGEVVKMEDAARPNLFMLRLAQVVAFTAADQERAREAVKKAFGNKLRRFDYGTEGDRIYLAFKEEPAAGKTPEAPQTPPASAPASQAAATQPASAPAAAVTPKKPDATLETATTDAIRAAFKGVNISVAQVQRFGRPEDHSYEVTLGGLGDAVRKGFESKLGAGVIKDIPQVESVGAKMGKQLRDDGIKAIIYSLLLILVYIAFRFDFRYAPGAVVALMHDVIIATGAVAITWTEFSMPVLAALLTIAGYSINDTIVIFDRIRENMGRHRDRKFGVLVNTSLNETMSRTILTSLTVFLTSIAIWVFGTGALKPFAFCLSVGLVAGTYSTIFIASPLLIVIHERFVKKPATAR